MNTRIQSGFRAFLITFAGIAALFAPSCNRDSGGKEKPAAAAEGAGNSNELPTALGPPATLAFDDPLPDIAAARLPDCSNANTTVEMTTCQGEAMAAADADLEATLTLLRTRLEDRPGAVERLNAAHEAWDVFRQAECNIDYARAYGGTIRGLFYGGCYERLTRARIEQIRLIAQSAGARIVPSREVAGVRAEALNAVLPAVTAALEKEFDEMGPDMSVDAYNSPKALANAQAAWAARRDADCAFVAELAGEDARSPCLDVMAARRAKELQNRLEEIQSEY